eukprot:Gb_30750 [translate_table: standard]
MSRGLDMPRVSSWRDSNRVASTDDVRAHQVVTYSGFLVCITYLNPRNLEFDLQANNPSTDYGKERSGLAIDESGVDIIKEKKINPVDSDYGDNPGDEGGSGIGGSKTENRVALNEKTMIWQHLHVSAGSDSDGCWKEDWTCHGILQHRNQNPNKNDEEEVMPVSRADYTSNIKECSAISTDVESRDACQYSQPGTLQRKIVQAGDIRVDCGINDILVEGRGFLRNKDWKEVVSAVNFGCGDLRYRKIMKQCNDNIDSLKKRYKAKKLDKGDTAADSVVELLQHLKVNDTKEEAKNES